MLPGRQNADDWLKFMLLQKNLWPAFTTLGTLADEISAQAFSKERRRLQVQHLWREVRFIEGCCLTECTSMHPRGNPKEELDALLSDKAARRNRTDPYDEKRYRGAGIEEVQA